MIIDIFGDGTGFDDGYIDENIHGSTLPPILTIFDNASNVINIAEYTPTNGIRAKGVVSGLPTQTAVFIAPSNDTYYVQVESESSTVSPDEYYVIEKR